MRKALIVGVILCLGAVVVPATASGAKAVRASGTPSLTANPSTGLLDGQSIAVTGSGLATKTHYELAECETGATDPLATCSPYGAALVKSNTSGSFLTSFSAVRMIEPFSGTAQVDCAGADACILALFDSDTALVASTPISFADVAIVPPTVTVTPSSGLLDGQKVSVTGTNWSAGAPVGISECPTGQTQEFCGSAFISGKPTSATGVLTRTFKVTRVIDGQEGPVDCAQPAACVLVATNLEEPNQTASTPISFADVTIVPPVLTVTPSADLVDGQTITVQGSGFRPHEDVAVSECSVKTGECLYDEDEDGTTTSNFGEVRTDGSGHFTTTLEAARVLTFGDSTVDCARAPGCMVGAIDEDSEYQTIAASAPMGFDPAVPPLPPLNLELTIDGTGQLVPGHHGRTDPEITGTISCNRSTATPVQFQLAVAQPGDKRPGGAFEFGTASCDTAGAAFSETVPARRGESAVPGIAGVTLQVSATSGSASQTTSLSASVTLVAPVSSVLSKLIKVSHKSVHGAR